MSTFTRITHKTKDFTDKITEVKIGKFTIGYISYDVYQNKSIHIVMINVREEYRRRGIASMLLRTVELLHPHAKIIHAGLTTDGEIFLKNRKKFLVGSY